MRAMFINDRKDLLQSLQMLYKELPEIVYAECHSVAEAQDALLRHRPDLVLLDHELTKNGQEGWEVLRFIRRVLPATRVMTTTYNPIAEEQYRPLGVEHVNLMDYESLRGLLRGEAPPGQRSTASG